MPRRSAFTLVELLVVIVAISIFAAILFPVFATSKASALQTSCLARFRQVGQATQLYLGDYDEYFMPVNHQPGQEPNGKTDRTWVQILLPYVESFQVFHCPADFSAKPESDSSFDQDLVPGDLFARYYLASMRVNLGYNFQYLAPVVGEGSNWMAKPISESSLENPDGMLLFADSVWAVEDGVPTGGGSWLVSPPCRYQQVDGSAYDTIGSTSGSPGVQPKVFTPMVGWQPSAQSSQAYGGAWPWHNGKLTMCSVGDQGRAVNVSQLGAGCDVQSSWTGEIFDRSQYVWSPSLP